MSPDAGSGIPGWFIALFVLVTAAGVATWIWRISVARRFAKEAGLDPNRAAAVTMLSNDGFSSAYLASALVSPPPHQAPPPSQDRPHSVEERLVELRALKDKGLVSADEYEAQRQKILGSI